MTLGLIAMILLTVFCMGLGQILFKQAALSTSEGTSFFEIIISLVFNPFFMSAIVLYGLTTILWAWILRSADLSVAYPFHALAIVLVPLVSVFLFNEPLTGRLIVALCLIVAGILVLSTGG